MVQSANRVFLIGKKQGQANAFFFDPSGEQVLVLELTVEQDTSALEAMLHRLLPGSRIRVEILNDAAVLTGTVRSPLDASRANELASRYVAQLDTKAPPKVLNMLTVTSEEQVMLKVVVAEVQREALKQMGINLGAAITSGAFQTAVLGENALPLTSAAGLGTLPTTAIDLAAKSLATGLKSFNEGPQTNTFGNNGVAGAWTGGNTRVAYALRALERQGLIRTLAEPNLTAISGEAAKFRAGGKFPVLVPAAPNQAPGIEFKDYGVYVAFTPVVLSEQRISLKIETEVSELTSVGAVVTNGYSVPALKSREAKSTVELPSGGSLALAGLLSDDVRQNIDGFPGLKDVPLLGALFRSRDFINKETELVVIVTAYVVKPTARSNLSTPVDGLAPPSDLRGIFLGHLNKVYGRDLVLRDRGLRNNGFIAE
jgi:pilus assembly protein CpaC